MLYKTRNIMRAFVLLGLTLMRSPHVTGEESEGKPQLAVIGKPEELRSMVESAISRSGCCITVDIAARGAILKEQAAYETGLFEDNQATKIGHLIHAEHMVVVSGESGVSSMRLIDVRTGRVLLSLAPGDARTQLDQLLQTLEGVPILRQISRLDLSRGRIKCSLEMEQHSFKVGQRMGGTLKCDTAGYLSVVFADKTGAITFLLPNSRSGPIPIQANRAIQFPEGLLPDRTITLEASEPYGIDELVVIVTSQPVSLADSSLLDQDGSARGTRGTRATRGAIAKIDRLGSEKWGAVKTCFETFKDKPTKSCAID